VFEKGKVPLNLWLQAAHLLCSSKKGFSSHQLHRVLGVTYKTAWFMTHRLREAMRDGKMPPLGGINKTVEIDESYREQHPTAVLGRYVMLAVTDTGCGMDRETQLRIFEPFFTTKELGKGTGLGLATVYGIVKQGGGYIWVYSEIAKGSVFKVYLPRLEQSAQSPKREEEQETSNGGEIILLAEDSDPLREMAREYLESAGYTVIEAVSGKDALQRAKEFEGMTDWAELLERYPEVTDILPHLDMPVAKGAARILDLHRRHAAEVKRAAFKMLERAVSGMWNQHLDDDWTIDLQDGASFPLLALLTEPHIAFATAVVTIVITSEADYG